MTRALAAAAVLLGAARAAAYCPCYTASSNANDHNCAIEAAPGDNPTVEQWNDLFAVAAGGPAAWGTDGPAVADIKRGCAAPTTIAAVYPCELIKAIGMAESGWKHFCVPETPADQVGKSSRTIISFDCGYGVSQVTSGMHVGEAPGFERERVAAEPLYNLATGMKILADKWRAVACVGDRRPEVIEDWYTAAWAYNGLSYGNNPNNPNFDSSRGAWSPTVGGAAPYQEKIFGWMEFTTRWPRVAVAYPALGDIGNDRAPPALPEPDCASPTDCASHRQAHVTACAPVSPAPDAGPPDGATAPRPPDGGAPVAGLTGDVTGGCAIGGRAGGGAWLLLVLAATWTARRPRRSCAR